MMKRALLALLLHLSLVPFSISAFAADIMFEGYYKIALEKKHIGYQIVRYEFDPKLQQFKCITFQRLKIGGEIRQRSLKAIATDKFRPLSYQFTSQEGDQIKVIDASFKDLVMKLDITDGKKKVKHETYKNPKDTIMSVFLPYVLLQNAMPVGKAFTYQGVAEEDGGVYTGKTWLESKQNLNGQTYFRTVNNFMREDFYSSLAVIPDPKKTDTYTKAEVAATNSPKSNVTAELVPNPSLATDGQLVPNKILITLFGSMPMGKANLIANPPAITADKPVTKPPTPLPAQKPATPTATPEPETN